MAFQSPAAPHCHLAAAGRTRAPQLLLPASAHAAADVSE